MALINTKEELINKLNEEGISEEWYSLDGKSDKPISFDGEYVYYHSLKRKIEDGEHYYFIYYELSMYKRDYDFYNSDKSMRVNSIKILTADGGSLESVRKPGEYELVQCSLSEKDYSILGLGYKFQRYVPYDGISYYHKISDASIFNELEIHFEKKTTMEEMEKYGFKYTSHGSCLRYPIPEELREKIIKYIDANGKLSIKDNCLIKEIIDCFTEEKLLKDEIERLDEYKEMLNISLNEEVSRQKQANIKDRKKLLEIYRRLDREYENIYFGVTCSEYRSLRIGHRCVDEAEELLGL